MVKLKISNDLVGTFGIALVFGAIFVFTNIFDWDYVFTTLEVDLRSIVLESRLPSWSYQMCAGSSRIGDPQSFGQSPLIIFPILFGAFWGAKILLFVAIFVGVHYVKKIIDLFDEELSFAVKHLYVFSFFTCNYFLFHFTAGHLSFASVLYAFPLLYLCIKIILKKEISPKDSVINSFFLFLIMSSGFYQASIYFIFPLAISFGLYLILNYRQVRSKDVFLLLISSLVPLALSAYRWLPVLEYQKLYPRTLNTSEWHNLYHQMLYFLMPITTKGFLYPFRVPDFSAGEDSYFGAISVALLILFLFRFKKFKGVLLGRNPSIRFALCLILVGVGFSLGNRYSFLPFGLLNSILKGSVRVPTRFNFLSYLGLLIIFLEVIKVSSLSKSSKKLFHISLLLVSLVSFVQHTDQQQLEYSMFQMKEILKIDPIYQDKMQLLHITRSRRGQSSYMFIPTLLGLSVPNCYQPMARKIYLMGEDTGNLNKPHDVHFIQSKSYQAKACQLNSYFTQNDIHIDKSCSKGSRLLFNFIEPELIEKYKISTTNEGYFL